MQRPSMCVTCLLWCFSLWLRNATLTGSWWWWTSSSDTRTTSCRRSWSTTLPCLLKCTWSTTTTRSPTPSPWQLCCMLRRPGCRSTNVKIAVIYNLMFVVIMTATSDADEAAAFAKDDIEENDDWKDWPSVFWKKWKHQLPNSSPRLDIVATVHYVAVACLRNYIFSWCFIALLVLLSQSVNAHKRIYGSCACVRSRIFRKRKKLLAINIQWA